MKMDIAITKMSSKGQIVIPQEMRGDFKVGEKILLIQIDKQIVLRKADNLSKEFEDDLEFARRTEEAYQEFKQDKSKFKKLEFDDFIEEMKKW